MSQHGAASETQLLTVQSSYGDVPCGGDRRASPVPAEEAWRCRGLGKWDLTAVCVPRPGPRCSGDQSGFSRG